MGVLIAVIFLGIVIFFHEFGHYIFAKLSGCAVSRFSLGFGPRIFGFRRRETEYCFSLLPIWGGYVKLVGMEGELPDKDEKEQETVARYGLKTYEELSAWSKLSILLGGILAQCLLCIFILSLIGAFIGRPVTQVMVGQPMAGSPALKAGLKDGDKIISIDGRQISSAQQMIGLVAHKPGQPMGFAVCRDNQDLALQIIPELNPEQGRVMIGVPVYEMFLGEYSKKDMRPIDYLTGGLVWTYKIAVFVLHGLWVLIRGRMSLEYLAGPVGIVSLTSQVARTGFLNLIIFFALINMNLAVINALPLPAVDGGHVAILLSEKIFRRRIPARAKNVINYIGYGLIIVFLFLVTLNDIKRLVVGSFQKQKSQDEVIDTKRIK